MSVLISLFAFEGFRFPIKINIEYIRNAEFDNLNAETSTLARKISRSAINMFGEITDGCGFNPIWNSYFFRVSFENILEGSIPDFVLYGRFLQLI